MAVFINVWAIHVAKWEEISIKCKMFLTDWWGVRGDHHLEVAVRRYGRGREVRRENGQNSISGELWGKPERAVAIAVSLNTSN
jgi:hypothetical protein